MITKRRLLVGLGLALLLAGCGRQSANTSAGSPQPGDAPPAAPAANEAAAPAPPAETAPAPVNARPVTAVRPIVVDAGGDAAAACAQLTQALRKFALQQRRLPASFEELVASGYVAGVPQPPPGKRYAIDRGSVVLVKQ